MGGQKSEGKQFAGSDRLVEVGWYHNNCDINGVHRTHPVKGKNPNELGLFDMSGNVWEWCWDWHGVNPAESMKNPRGPIKGEYRVLRGGSWNNGLIDCRLNYSLFDTPNYRNDGNGFRLTQGLPSALSASAGASA